MRQLQKTGRLTAVSGDDSLELSEESDTRSGDRDSPLASLHREVTFLGDVTGRSGDTEGRLASLTSSSDEELFFRLTAFVSLVIVILLSEDSVDEDFCLEKRDEAGPSECCGSELDLLINFGKLLEAGLCHFDSGSTNVPGFGLVLNFSDFGID